jgi:hypothetical protein
LLPVAELLQLGAQVVHETGDQQLEGDELGLVALEVDEIALKVGSLSGAGSGQRPAADQLVLEPDGVDPGRLHPQPVAAAVDVVDPQLVPPTGSDATARTRPRRSTCCCRCRACPRRNVLHQAQLHHRWPVHPDLMHAVQQAMRLAADRPQPTGTPDDTRRHRKPVDGQTGSRVGLPSLSPLT